LWLMGSPSGSSCVDSWKAFCKPEVVFVTEPNPTVRYMIIFLACATAIVLADCSGSGPTAPVVSMQPQSATLANGAVAAFGVQATGQQPLAYQWSKNGIAITGATGSTYLTSPVGSSDSGSSFSVVVTNSLGKANSASAVLTVVAAPIDVLTYHNDLARTGQNSNEVRLMPTNVTQTHFKKLGLDTTDGKVDAQPLIASGVNVNGSFHNVLYIATEHDSVYAYDADSGALLWKASLLPSGSGESPSDTVGCNFVSPEIGVTATPVIDRTRGAIYVVAMSKSASGTYFQRLHALSLATGTEMFGGPTQVPSVLAGQSQTFVPLNYLERAALLLVNGEIFTSWTSHCDNLPYSSWVIAFDADTMQVAQSFNGEQGDPTGAGSFWNGGSGPSADSIGNVYLLSANGTFDTTLDAAGFPQYQDYGNSFIRLDPPVQASATLNVHDYFAIYNTLDESAADKDLGSGGTMLLPDQSDSSGMVRQLIVGAGKDNNVYVVDRNNMGHYRVSDNTQIWQELVNAFPNAQYGIFGAPAYFNGRVYYGAVADGISAFTFSNARLSETAVDETAVSFPYPGATFSISANGARNGIVWAVENSTTEAVLHAFDASNLTTELYNSTQAGSRDILGPGSKFTPPTIANGKVYVATQVDLTNDPTGLQNGVAVFGAF
jgi:hypothetical protein